jgi:cell wall assembly regulator SMI1
MEQVWNRIESWLTAHAPELLERLLPGATEAELARFEAALGVHVPEDLRRSLAIHAGQPAGSYGVLGDWTLFRIADSLDRWRMHMALRNAGTFVDPSPGDVQGPVQPVWWSASWIPVAGDGAGSLLCADLAPATGGRQGQIVRFFHDAPARDVIASSFQELLARFADDLEVGHYRAERAHGAAWLIDTRSEAG